MPPAKWSPSAGLTSASALGKRKVSSTSSAAKLLQIFLIATVDADKIVDIAAGMYGFTLVFNAPFGPDDDKDKYSSLLTGALTKRGISLLKDGYTPFYNVRASHDCPLPPRGWLFNR